jgi:hypothetical protein
LQLINPYLFRDRVVGGNTHEFGLYVGAVPIALLVWLLVGWTSLRINRRFAAAALCCAGLAFWLALGQAGVIYTWQTYLPVIGRFRLPARYLVLVHLALAAAAAVAFAELCRVAARTRKVGHTLTRRASEGESRIALPRWRFGLVSGFRAGCVSPLWRMSAVSLVIGLGAGWIWGTEVVQPWPLRLAGPALLAIATILIGYAASGARLALPALVVLTALDLGVYGCSYAIWPNTFTLETALSTIPDADVDGAKIATELRDPSHPSLRVGNQMVLKGWRQLDGYAGLEPARRFDYRDVGALRVAGVERVLRTRTTGDIAGLIPLDDRWLTVPDPLPRARLVDASSPAEVQILSDRPGAIHLRTQTKGLAQLVVSERFHPGWRVRIDGRAEESPARSAEFLACTVKADESIVEFVFQPSSLRYGKWLSAVGLVFLALYGAARWSRP